MNYPVLLIAIILTGCTGSSKKPVQTGAATITFNGFAMGTPLDTLTKRLGDKPTLQTDDELDYQNVMAEGVRWQQITYSFLAGKLARATATQSGLDAASYKKLYQSLSGKYGKPAQNVDSLTIWARRDAELSLQPGIILFSRR